MPDRRGAFPRATPVYQAREQKESGMYLIYFMADSAILEEKKRAREAANQ
jgi:hypothetical protein